MNKKSRVDVIEPLRAIAALSVCWFHFTNVLQPEKGLVHDHWLKNSGSFGWLGVIVFFVISGFVIPLSMYAGDFNFKVDWKTFFGKRILRIDPPYIVSIGLSVGLLYLSSILPSFSGQAPNVSWIQLISHLGYLNAFLGDDWLNPAYWTLAIEFQYYIVISGCYFLVVSPNKNILYASTIAIASLSFLPIGSKFVLHFMVIFAFGIVTFQHYTGIISHKIFKIQILVLSIISFITLGVPSTVAAISTSMIITFVRVKVPYFISFIGMISYSIYLIHGPIGGRVVNFGLRFAHTLPMKIIVFGSAFAVTIVAGYIMYLAIECPAKNWSASLKYQPKYSADSRSNS
jgi:peptidoglycan/LPS O-acetylase OafA/YrhL